MSPKHKSAAWLFLTLSLTNCRTIFPPFILSNMIWLAPGCLCAPLITALRSRSMLCTVTLSGYVRILAQWMGTPTSSTDRLGSGEITVRDEKSTRFPLRFCLNRPCFPFRRWTKARMGFESRSLGSPGVSELMYWAINCCISSQFSFSIPRSPPFSMCPLIQVFAWMMSAIFTVKSSSLVPELPPLVEVGLIQTGGTSMLVTIMSSGLPNSGFRFRRMQSSSGTCSSSWWATRASMSSFT
mmetsp:Transcript_20171/g.33182  ORF Transcript_20171/g.33182 Transcript_20171/m.33182 type:complete len:240 (-) Transcript_20171:104-823(-)